MCVHAEYFNLLVLLLLLVNKSATTLENNGVTPEWGCNPFSSNSIVFNENSIASVIAEMSQH